MHPKNIFHLRPLVLVLGVLLGTSGSCHLVNVWSDSITQERLVSEGVEVMASVHELNGEAWVSARTNESGASHCQWHVTYLDIECIEIFALPCPSGIKSTPLIYLEDDPTVCRVLSRSAVAAEQEVVENSSKGWLVTGFGLGLLALASRRSKEPAPQVPVKDQN
jgi:hypothetical protein